MDRATRLPAMLSFLSSVFESESQGQQGCRSAACPRAGPCLGYGKHTYQKRGSPRGCHFAARRIGGIGTPPQARHGTPAQHRHDAVPPDQMRNTRITMAEEESGIEAALGDAVD